MREPGTWTLYDPKIQTANDFQLTGPLINNDIVAYNAVASKFTNKPISDFDTDYLRVDGVNSMLADLDLGGNNLVNTDTIIGFPGVVIKDSASASVITVDNTATHISGITEFTGADITWKLKIDCDGTSGPTFQFNSNYKSFLDTF